jgi:hypothetical protein
VGLVSLATVLMVLSNDVLNYYCSCGAAFQNKRRFRRLSGTGKVLLRTTLWLYLAGTRPAPGRRYTISVPGFGFCHLAESAKKKTVRKKNVGASSSQVLTEEEDKGNLYSNSYL